MRVRKSGFLRSICQVFSWPMNSFRVGKRRRYALHSSQNHCFTRMPARFNRRLAEAGHYDLKGEVTANLLTLSAPNMQRVVKHTRDDQLRRVFAQEQGGRSGLCRLGVLWCSGYAEKTLNEARLKAESTAAAARSYRQVHAHEEEEGKRLYTPLEYPVGRYGEILIVSRVEQVVNSRPKVARFLIEF